MTLRRQLIETLATSIAVLLLTVSGGARAQSAEPRDDVVFEDEMPPTADLEAAEAAKTEAAEVLFQQARALFEAGDLAPACEKLAASQALEPGIGTLLYLGDCHERLGRFASALAAFEAAQKLAKARGDEGRHHLASVRAAALAPRTPRLEVRGGPGLADLQITVNGEPLALTHLNRAVPRDAGTYEVRFSAPGYQAFVSKVQLRNGRERSVVIRVPRLAPTVPAVIAAREPRERSRSEAGDGQRVLAWIVTGAGVALAGAGGVLTALASAKNDASKQRCDALDPNRCSAEGVRLRSRAQDLALAATMAGVAGGIGIASGVVLFVTATPSAVDRSPDTVALVLRRSWF